MIAPPAVVAAVRATAAAEGLPIVRQVGERLQGASWELVAVDRNGRRLRQSRGFPNGGEAWIRPDLDGCDPSYVILGRPAVPLFSSDPRCAGDPAAPVAHPSDVGGAVVGQPFPLTVATDGPRLLAEVNGRRYASTPLLATTSTVGTAVLRRNGTLLVTLGASPVALAPV